MTHASVGHFSGAVGCLQNIDHAHATRGAPRAATAAPLSPAKVRGNRALTKSAQFPFRLQVLCTTDSLQISKSLVCATHLERGAFVLASAAIGTLPDFLC
jgi:hypothetical protein